MVWDGVPNGIGSPSGRDGEAVPADVRRGGYSRRVAPRPSTSNSDSIRIHPSDILSLSAPAIAAAAAPARATASAATAETFE